MQRWNAHVKVRKFAFDKPFNIHVFIGHVKDDQTARFMTKKNEVGLTTVFASAPDTQGEEQGGAGGCVSCKKNRDADMLVQDVIPLTSQLQDYLRSNPGSESLIRDGVIKTIPDLEPQHVEPFFGEHLRWRVTDLAANLISGREREARLEITVTSRTFTPPNERDILGVYGPFTAYPSITRDKAGGLGFVYTN